MNEEYTRLDRMRYTKNTTSSRLAILAIVFDVLFFISLYKSDVGTYYYTILIGASIIYNLVFLLTAFLCSEGVKNYQPGYSWALVILGIIQIVRIFIYPVQAHSAFVGGVQVMGDAQFIRMIVYLVLSAISLFASAFINWQKSSALAKHIASLETEISELKASNAATESRISTTTNLNSIKESAISELGMVYAGTDQIVFYTIPDEDYMDRYE